jgi:pimeloyl-ACP methyl ester carboxylesterase
VEHSTLELPVRGGALHAGVWGDSGPLVIAAHGITAQHRCWAQVGPDLGRDHRFVALDLRGRGRSRDLPGPYGIAGHAADVAAVVKRFDEPPILVGHSMGAMVMAAAARLGTGRRVVLVDGGPLVQPPAGVEPDSPREEIAAAVAAAIGPAFARLSMRFAGPEEYREFWRAHPSLPREWDDAIRAYVDGDLVPDGAGGWRAACRLEAAERDAVDLYNYTGVPEEPLPVPAVFLRAERGMLDEPDKPFYPAGYASTWLPGVDERDVAGVNHYTITLARAGSDAVAAAVRG